jgi:hypothetical protein
MVKTKSLSSVPETESSAKTKKRIESFVQTFLGLMFASMILLEFLFSCLGSDHRTAEYSCYVNFGPHSWIKHEQQHVIYVIFWFFVVFFLFCNLLFSPKSRIPLIIFLLCLVGALIICNKLFLG